MAGRIVTIEFTETFFVPFLKNKIAKSRRPGYGRFIATYPNGRKRTLYRILEYKKQVQGKGLECERVVLHEEDNTVSFNHYVITTAMEYKCKYLRAYVAYPMKRPRVERKNIGYKTWDLTAINLKEREVTINDEKRIYLKLDEAMDVSHKE